MVETPTYHPDIDTVKGARGWSLLEQRVLDDCVFGHGAYLWDRMEVPDDCSDPDLRVRAGLIRYLMLGGCAAESGARPHHKGVTIRGGWIDGVLDLAGCVSALKVALQKCLISERLDLSSAQINGLYLPGCVLPKGANLQRSKIQSSVHLRDGFSAKAGVDLGGAEIGGQLACDGGQFLATEGRALNCAAARIGVDVFMDDGFRANAKVDFIGAQIGGQLACTGGQFLATKGPALNCETAQIGGDVLLRGGFRADAAVNFIRAVIGGNLQIIDATLEDGFHGESMRVEHGFLWKGVSGGRKAVDLTDTHVGVLRDDWASWNGVGGLILDGFRYDRLERSLTIAQRLKWLGKNRRKAVEPPKWVPDPATATDFDPQPYVQLATVLRTQGDRAGAARVLVKREIKQRRAERQRAYVGLDGTWAAGVASVLEDLKRPVNLMFRLFFGYGHKPMRALWWVAGFVLFGAWLFGTAFDAGQMAPNSDVILTSADWLGAVAGFEAGGDLPQLTWAALPETQDYETFNRLIYGLDLFVPLDALGQENAWAPSPARGALGQWGFYLRPVIQAAGWIMTALGAAVLTGLVGRRD